MTHAAFAPCIITNVTTNCKHAHIHISISLELRKHRDQLLYCNRKQWFEQKLRYKAYTKTLCKLLVIDVTKIMGMAADELEFIKITARRVTCCYRTKCFQLQLQPSVMRNCSRIYML